MRLLKLLDTMSLCVIAATLAVVTVFVTVDALDVVAAGLVTIMWLLAVALTIVDLLLIFVHGDALLLRC